MKLKICGMKYNDNISLISKLNPDYMGFIFYDKSKRFFDNEPIPRVNKNIKKVGVFVDPEIEYLNFIIKKYSLDLVQLHGNEKPDFISQIQDVKIIKAFSIDKNFNFNSTENYMKCDYFLFDTKGKLPGGNGISFDWKILTSYKFNKPYFLSGGIGLHNIEQLKDFFSSTISKYCFAVDINSHFEIEYAKKDYELIKKFKNEL